MQSETASAQAEQEATEQCNSIPLPCRWQTPTGRDLGEIHVCKEARISSLLDSCMHGPDKAPAMLQTTGRRLTQSTTTVAYSNLASGSYQFNVQPQGTTTGTSADSTATTTFSVQVHSALAERILLGILILRRAPQVSSLILGCPFAHLTCPQA